MPRVETTGTILDRRDGIPLYVTLQNRIEDLARAQHLQPGDALPSEASLQAHFGVSRATVRQALATLERRGLVERRQGKGTFLRVPTMEHSLPELTSFSEHVAAQKMRPASELVAYRVTSVGQGPDTLHFPKGADLACVVRIRYANTVAVGLHTVYLPLAIAEQIGFSRDALHGDRSLSLYALFEGAGVHLAWAEEHLQARGADPGEARLLGVAAGTPVMSVLRLTRDHADRLVEVVRAVYLGDKYDYVVHLERHSGGAARGGLITPEASTHKEEERR